MKEKTNWKPEIKSPSTVIPTDEKILQVLTDMNDTLIEIKDILDNTWRERRPK